MLLTVNGAATDVNEPCTVKQLLERLELASGPCAVEVNGELVTRTRHESHDVADGDVVEIVTLVGGG